MAPRVGFVTCVQLGLDCLEELAGCGADLRLVVTLPDDRARAKSGRVALDPFCGPRGIPLLKAPSVNDAAVVAALGEQAVDWLFVVGWSQLARGPVLAAPRLGALGMHPTLLPEGRGRAPIPWAILKGLTSTGVTLFVLDAGVDSGPILAQERIAVAARETATTLYAKVVDAHRALIRQAWPGLAQGRIAAVPQDEARASYWPARRPADGRLEPSFTVAEADRLVRATTRPYPGAFLPLADGRLRIWAGEPARGAPAAPGTRRLAFADGAYDAREFELEGPE